MGKEKKHKKEKRHKKEKSRKRDRDSSDSGSDSEQERAQLRAEKKVGAQRAAVCLTRRRRCVRQQSDCRIAAAAHSIAT
jgi:hypothetical protein